MSDSFISLSKPEPFSSSDIAVHWNAETGQHVVWLGNDIRVHLTPVAATTLAAELATSLDAERLGGAVTR